LGKAQAPIGDDEEMDEKCTEIDIAEAKDMLMQSIQEASREEVSALFSASFWPALITD
jgi:hypothetical protein